MLDVCGGWLGWYRGEVGWELGGGRRKLMSVLCCGGKLDGGAGMDDVKKSLRKPKTEEWS